MLNDFQLKGLKPRERPYLLSDGGGLHIVITPSGAKVWRLKYRFQGRQKKLHIGPYPDVGLWDARQRRSEAKKQIAAGEDPAHIKRLAKLKAVASAANTFGVLAEEWLARSEKDGAAPATMKKNVWLLRVLAKPLWDRPIADIAAAEIYEVLKRVEASGRLETANRLRTLIGSVFRLAVVTMRAPTDPTYALKDSLRAPVVAHHAAIIEPKGLGQLLRAIDEYDGWKIVRASLQFAALTMCRPGEVRTAGRSEIDEAKKIWTIPEAKMKMRRPHIVPLSRQALAVLDDVWDLDCDERIFPSLRSRTKPLSENAMNAALRRMGFTKEEHTAHGFRSSASTILNDLGFDPDVIEAALAHRNEGKVRSIYNRGDYLRERVELMQKWADLLDDFRKL